MSDRQAPSSRQPRSKRPPLPGRGAAKRRVEEMIRVDHAGEYGAVTIYAAQKRVYKSLPKKAEMARAMQRMEDDEQAHLDAFDDLIATRRVRPTALAPLWTLGGTFLGVSTALMSENAAHACTEAVESVIEGHYGDQIEELDQLGEDALSAKFTQFREEEIAHKHEAIEEGARDTFGHPVLSAAIKIGCRIAIKVSERV